MLDILIFTFSLVFSILFLSIVDDFFSLLYIIVIWFTPRSFFSIKKHVEELCIFNFIYVLMFKIWCLFLWFFIFFLWIFYESFIVFSFIIQSKFIIYYFFCFFYLCYFDFCSFINVFILFDLALKTKIRCCLLIYFYCNFNTHCFYFGFFKLFLCCDFNPCDFFIYSVFDLVTRVMV
jgi:hypothetical protein